MQPVLEYACAVWDPEVVTVSDALEHVQNRAARFVTNDYDFHHSVLAMKESFGWETLERRRLHYKLELFDRIYFNKTGSDKSLYRDPSYFVSARCDQFQSSGIQLSQ